MISRRRLDDGRILTVYGDVLGTASLLIDDNLAMHEAARRSGLPTESDGGADFYFQYMSIAEALTALAGMEVDDHEPGGWIRAAPPRFRRRPGGDPAKEYIAE